MGVEAFAVLQEMDVNKDQIIQTDEFAPTRRFKLGSRRSSAHCRSPSASLPRVKKIKQAVNKRQPTRKTVVPPANADESAAEASAPAS